MSHDLERHRKEGSASFVYRKEGGIPWHRLGVAVDGHQPMEVMLQAAYANYEVEVVPVYVIDPRSGSLVEVERQFATARINPHTDEYQPLGTVKGRYTVLQNKSTLEHALDVIEASTDDAVFDTLGVLDDGRQFFATIDLGTLVIDPGGVEDKIGRFLVVRSSHDGSTALTFSNTDIRAVCKNTVILGERNAVRVFRTKHTPNIEERLSTAREVLKISTEWAKDFKVMADEMLAIDMTPGKFDKVINAVFPASEATTDKKLKNRSETVDLLKAIYASPTNAPRVGNNGWAAWNAVVEYFDHYRPGTPEERALTSMDDGSWVTRKKVLAHRAVQTLA